MVTGGPAVVVVVPAGLSVGDAGGGADRTPICGTPTDGVRWGTVGGTGWWDGGVKPPGRVEGTDDDAGSLDVVGSDDDGVLVGAPAEVMSRGAVEAPKMIATTAISSVIAETARS